MDVLIYCEAISVGRTIHRALELEVVNEIGVVSAGDVTHKPLDLRNQSNMAGLEAHSNGTRSCRGARIAHQVIVEGLGEF